MQCEEAFPLYSEHESGLWQMAMSGLTPKADVCSKPPPVQDLAA